MDMERGISGAPLFNYKAQIEQFLDILDEKTPFLNTNRQYEYRKTILPFLAIDPNNPDAYEYFLSAFIKDYNQTGIAALDNSAPFVGVKLYPVLGYWPLDPVLLDIYKICEAKNIPITTHCGGLRTRTNRRKVEIGQRKEVNGELVDVKKVVDVSSKKKSKAIFIDPLHWEKVAKQFPKLKINLAHFGDNVEWKSYHKDRQNPKNFVFKTLKMIRTYPNVYADISYAYYDEENRVKMAGMMNTERYKDKILYGSDFYMTEVEKFRTRDILKKFEENFTHIGDKYHLLTSQNPFAFLFEPAKT
jgi:predicted TIM-barrel fold metal-dependent hydrolase